MGKIIEIEGVGEVYARKLIEAGIETTEALLEKGASPKARKELAEKTGIAEKLVLRWVNHADLFRVKGIGGEYAELLEAAGIDTVPELAQRNPDSLLQKLSAANEERKLVRKLPAQAQVNKWVEEAKTLGRVITY
jgi:predicted flap endonuclease-1-like 5' DNA nuclease